MPANKKPKNIITYLRPMQKSSTALQIAAYLLETEAVKLRPETPFTWSSGWLSPIYCDNRVTLSHPAIRSFIKTALAEEIRIHFPEVEAIGGVATAGIAQGALVADLLELPYLYVRPEPKSHGMGNQIEGRLLPEQKVVLVEDLISTGGSSLKAASAVNTAGGNVIVRIQVQRLGTVCIINQVFFKGLKLFFINFSRRHRFHLVFTGKQKTVFRKCRILRLQILKYLGERSVYCAYFFFHNRFLLCIRLRVCRYVRVIVTR